MKFFIVALATCGLIVFLPHFPGAQQRSIRFHGNSYEAPGTDRVMIPLTGNSPVNVSGDFTIEFWLKCRPSENNGHVYAADHGDGWVKGNVLVDRDVFGNADPGDFSMAIGQAPGLPAGTRVVAFGINRKGTGITITGNTQVADGNWHHLAVVRESGNGSIRIYVDGRLDAQGRGPVGEIHFDTTKTYSRPQSDPFLVLGAEKHDGVSSNPSYRGWLDEFRLSNSVRYAADFNPATTPFVPDDRTMALFHFDEGRSDLLQNDQHPANAPVLATVHYGGQPAGPSWDDSSPFQENDFRIETSSPVNAKRFVAQPSIITRQEGAQLVIRNETPVKSLVIWSSDGRRLAERKNIQPGTMRVPLGNARGIVFIHVSPEGGSPYTSKLAIR